MDFFIGVSHPDVDLTVDDQETGLMIKPVPAQNQLVRELMELDSIFSISSFMGCTCGLCFADWSRKDPRENHEKRVSNVLQFRQILADHPDSIVRIMTLEKYGQAGLEDFPRSLLDLDSMSESVREFSLDSDRVYELWPEGKSGPHDIESVFPPRRLDRNDLDGAAPDVGDYRRDYSGKAWNEIELTEFDRHGDMFHFMAVNSIRHLLPGILMTCLNNPGGGLHEGLMHFCQRPGFVKLYRMLNADQQFFLMQMCQFLLRNPDVSDNIRKGFSLMRQSCLNGDQMS